MVSVGSGGEVSKAARSAPALHSTRSPAESDATEMNSTILVSACRKAIAVLPLAAMFVAGCSGGSNPSNTPQNNGTSGPAFVVGTDAPMANVVSFAVQLQSIDAIDSSGNKVPLLSGTPTVNFAHYNGLQTLVDINDVPAGAYSSVSITLGSGTIGYLNTQTVGAPAIQTEAATMTQSTVTATLSTPLVITHAGAPAGLRVDFDLGKSIETDSNGQITGQVTPTFNVSAVSNTDAHGYIDELVSAVVSVNASGQSFVVQGPHGEQFTINVNGQTEWEGSDSLSSLSTNSIVQLSGMIDAADQTMDADDVDIVSQNGFFAGGQVTYVQPASGAATSFDLYVNSLLPATTGVSLGQLAQVDLTGSEKFLIYWMHNPLTQFLFNSSQLVAGQSVAIGGSASGAANAQAVAVNRISLRHWGFDGTIVANSVNTSQDTFQMNINGFAGVLVPQAVTVYVAGKSEFRGGFNAITDLSSNANVRVVGLLLKDPTSGQIVLLAHYVDDIS